MQQYVGMLPFGLKVEILANGNVRAMHNGGFEPNEGDIVEAGFFGQHGGRRLVRLQRAPFGNSHVFVLSNGSEVAAVESTTGPFDAVALSRVGGRNGTNDALDGRFHEALILHGALAPADRVAIEDYLRVKWGL